MPLLTDFIMPLAYVAALAAPFYLLRLYAFREDLRFSPLKNAVLLLLLLAVCLGSRFALGYFYPQTPLFAVLHSVGFFLVGSILPFLLVKRPFFEQLFVHMLLVLYFDLIAANARYVGKWLTPGSASPYPLQIVAIFIQILLTLPLVRSFFRNVLGPLMLGVKTNAWHALWLLPTCLFAAYFPAVELLESSLPSFLLIPIRLMAFCCCFVLISAVLRALEQVAQDAKIQENKRMVVQLLATQEEQYAMLGNCIADIKSVKQDYKLNVIHIKNLFAQHAYSKLNSFLTYGANTPMDSEISYCDIPSIDTLVRYYIRTTDKLSIRLTVRLSLPPSTPQLENDLSILIGNCLANAVEACECMESGSNKFIEIRARKTENTIAIVTENSYANYSVPREELGRHYSMGKRYEEEGIGATCIRAIAERYHAKVKVEAPGGGIMRTSLALVLPPPAPHPSLGSAQKTAPAEEEGETQGISL